MEFIFLRRKCLFLFIGVLIIVGCTGMSSKTVDSSPLTLGEVKSFTYYLAGSGRINVLSKFDLVVIDPDNYTTEEIAVLKSKGVLVYGYLSVGEAEGYRWFYSQVNPDWMMGENPDWDDNYYVDVNQAGWHRLLLYTVIPDMVKKGFDGIYLDTVDTASPYNFPETRAGMAALIKAIKKNYPNKPLIANNPGFMIKDIADYIDVVAIEDVFSYYDHTRKIYKKTPASVSQLLIKELRYIKKKYNLPIFTIDYARPVDRSLIRYDYHSSSSYGFVPYVGTVELNRILLFRGH